MESRFHVKYSLLLISASVFLFAFLQGLLTHRLNDAEVFDLVYELGFDIKFAKFALDQLQLPTAEAQRLTGLPLVEAASPPTTSDPVIVHQSFLLQQGLCKSSVRCPLVLPTSGHRRGAWVQLLSKKKQVWLFVPLHPPQAFQPDAELLGASLALVIGSLTTTLVFLWLEVERPLRKLEGGYEALMRGGIWSFAPQGTRSVRRVNEKFFTMAQSLESKDQERALMLAGVAHDLKTPLTRLRLRLEQGGDFLSRDRQRAAADLDALERITGQFLLFAGGGDAEPAVVVNLDAWLAELSAPLEADQVVLDLEHLERRVQPTALARAVGNLIDNCLGYGRLPLRLVLRSDLPAGEGFRIEVWDRGEGIGPDAWEQALKPFHRIEQSRSGQGHCGLGLAIALRVALAHGGSLEAIRSEEGFAVVLRGRSL